MSLDIKYEPKTMADVVYQDNNAQNVITHFLAVGSLCVPGNLLLHGPFGTGKSITARVSADDLLEGTYRYNAKDFSGSKFKTSGQVNDAISNFASYCALGAKYRVVIIDELDAMSDIAQVELRFQMDCVKKMCAFIFTTNNISKVDGAIQSRCRVLYYGPANPVRWVPRAQMIMSSEGVSITAGELLPVLQGSGGDIRMMFQNMEVIIQAHKQASLIASSVPPVPPTPSSPAMAA